MTTQEIIKAFEQIKNGAFFKVEWDTDLMKNMTSKAKLEHTATKHVTAVCRKGIHYTSIASVREEKVKAGDYFIDQKTGKCVITSAPRSWAVDIVPNLIIQHKTTLKEYVVLYPALNIPKVEYKLDGNLITPAKLKASEVMCNSFWTEKSHSSVITVPVESIRKITSKGVRI